MGEPVAALVAGPEGFQFCRAAVAMAAGDLAPGGVLSGEEPAGRATAAVGGGAGQEGGDSPVSGQRAWPHVNIPRMTSACGPAWLSSPRVSPRPQGAAHEERRGTSVGAAPPPRLLSPPPGPLGRSHPADPDVPARGLARKDFGHGCQVCVQEALGQGRGSRVSPRTTTWRAC